MKIFYSCLLALLMLSSCQRRNTTIRGKVVDECSKTPIGNATVELWTGEKNSNKRIAKMETQQTWPDGSYYFHFHTGFLSDRYWVECNGAVSEYVGKREDKEFNLLVPDPAKISYLEIKTKNISPFDSSDSIFIDAICPNSNYPYHLQYRYKGMSIDTMNRITVNGCPPKLVNINWSVTKNNVTTHFTDAATCTNGSTSQFLISY
jgi:hypothetical protein